MAGRRDALRVCAAGVSNGSAFSRGDGECAAGRNRDCLWAGIGAGVPLTEKTHDAAVPRGEPEGRGAAWEPVPWEPTFHSLSSVKHPFTIKYKAYP